MIEVNEIFSDSDERVAWWFDKVDDTNDLAVMAEEVIQENIKLVSVAPESVQFLWTCLENKNTKIMTRYSFYPTKKNIESQIYNLVQEVASIFKVGASGVQLFVKLSDLDQIIANLGVVRDDLFFEHDLSVGMDICDIGVSDYGVLFQKLRDIHANSLVLTLKKDTGKKSDFIGRVYGLLQNWDFDGQLHFVLNNDYYRIDQVTRLVESEKPELSEKLRFFLNY